MTRIFPALLFSAATLLSTAALPAQQDAPPPPPPIAPAPPALAAAKTVFLSNAGADSGLFPHPFSGDPDRPYSQLYSSIKASGFYQIVPDPSEADLVLELQLTAPNGSLGGNKQYGTADPLPMFRLTIYDRKTHYILWTFTESIEQAALQKTHDHNLDQALDRLLTDFERVTQKIPLATP